LAGVSAQPRPSSDDLNETHLAIRSNWRHPDDQKAKLNAPSREIDENTKVPHFPNNPPAFGLPLGARELSHFFFDLRPEKKFHRT